MATRATPGFFASTRFPFHSSFISLSWISLFLGCVLLTSVASATTEARGPAFISTACNHLFPTWSTSLVFQSITGNKGIGLEAMTPSAIYGRAALRLNVTRNSIQTYNITAQQQNPTMDLEYYTFNIIAINVIVPFASGVDSISPYVGGGFNIVVTDDDVSDSKTQLNLGVLGGMNYLLRDSDGSRGEWALLAEFGYNTENAEANKLVGSPAIADGFVARTGLRYFF